MSGPLDNMSSLAAANSEADLQQKLHSPELWRRLQLFRLAVLSSSSGESTTESREKRTKLVLGLLKDVELRVLFVAVDFCHGQAGDETKQAVAEVALLSVLESSVGQELLQEVCVCSAVVGRRLPSDCSLHVRLSSATSKVWRVELLVRCRVPTIPELGVSLDGERAFICNLTEHGLLSAFGDEYCSAA